MRDAVEKRLRTPIRQVESLPFTRKTLAQLRLVGPIGVLSGESGRNDFHLHPARFDDRTMGTNREARALMAKMMAV